MKHLSKKLNAVLLFCSTYGSPMESCKTNDCIQIIQINVAHSLSLSFLFVCGACSWLKNWQNLGTIWNFLRKCLLQCEKRYGRIQCCLASENNFDFFHAFPMFLHLCLPVELFQWPWDCFCSRFESLKKFFSHCPIGIIQKGSRCVGSNTDADKESVL